MRVRSLAAAAALAGAVVLGGAGAASAHGWGQHHHGFHGAGASGVAAGSPGVLSGNNVQVPIDIPINLCGNSINVIGLVNPAMGNTCVNA